MTELEEGFQYRFEATQFACNGGAVYRYTFTVRAETPNDAFARAAQLAVAFAKQDAAVLDKLELL